MNYHFARPFQIQILIQTLNRWDQTYHPLVFSKSCHKTLVIQNQQTLFDVMSYSYCDFIEVGLIWIILEGWKEPSQLQFTSTSALKGIVGTRNGQNRIFLTLALLQTRL